MTDNLKYAEAAVLQEIERTKEKLSPSGASSGGSGNTPGDGRKIWGKRKPSSRTKSLWSPHASRALALSAVMPHGSFQLSTSAHYI
jgi:hypothetical protein